MHTDLEEKRLSLLPEDFVDMVSHEMRTPLTSIRASLGLMAAGVNGATTKEQSQALEIAISNLERMGRLLDDLLDMTKIRVGRLELRRDRVDWVSLIHEIAQTFAPLAQQRGVALIFDVPEGPLVSYVDRDKIIQILTNLVHNALKFTPQGQITVSVSRGSDVIECSVSDTGPGIPPESLSRLFSKFTQLGIKSHTGERGSGLGLSLARQLVELHGGAIRAENISPKGARFSFSIPTLDARGIFELETERLLRLAERHEQPLSLAWIKLHHWPLIETKMGQTKAAALMNHYEDLIRTSMRGQCDFILQSPGIFWLAAYPVNKTDAQNILRRLRQTLEAEPLLPTAPIDLTAETRLATFPDDAATPYDLLSHLGTPS